ncbi:hypothetical protein AK830_g10182 [Neonectria ditissima]|uniref:Uncharacterized protein n=1 Tax=Neonectria ditissima TaxID=78410 RepID=A0A0N8H5J9_9HYPO|nr:hypothetical protein AK830_g10182 [Neonectria ditissima]
MVPWIRTYRKYLGTCRGGPTWSRAKPAKRPERLGGENKKLRLVSSLLSRRAQNLAPPFLPPSPKKGLPVKTSTTETTSHLPLPPGPSDFPGPARPELLCPQVPSVVALKSPVPFPLTPVPLPTIARPVWSRLVSSGLVSSRLSALSRPVLSPTSLPFPFPRTGPDPGSTASGPWTKPPDPRSSRLAAPSLLASLATGPPLGHSTLTVRAATQSPNQDQQPFTTRNCSSPFTLPPLCPAPSARANARLRKQGPRSPRL